jgi:hypothetical protein
MHPKIWPDANVAFGLDSGRKDTWRVPPRAPTREERAAPPPAVASTRGCC